ncbi:MAG: type II CAAX prenyl endopeptidase Rce1 family protein [Candidatus Hermodarchaeota archaeon]
MRTCPRCNKEVFEGQKFCGYCGIELGTSSQIICPRCGRSNSATKFCIYCGVSFTAPPRTITSSDSWFSRFREKNLPGLVFSLIFSLITLSAIPIGLAMVPFMGGTLEAVVSLETEFTLITTILAELLAIGVILILIYRFRIGIDHLKWKSKESLNLSKPLILFFVASGFLTIGSLILGIILDVIFNFLQLSTTASSPYDTLFSFSNPIVIILTFLAAVIMAPIFEEILFRGYLLPVLQEKLKMGPFAAVLLSSLFFAAIHVQADLASSLYFTLLHFFGTFTLGVVLGFIYVQTEDIRPVIFFHAFNNLVALSFEVFLILPFSEFFGLLDLILSLFSIGVLGVYALFKRYQIISFFKNILQGLKETLTVPAFSNTLMVVIISLLIPLPLIFLVGSEELYYGLVDVLVLLTVLGLYLLALVVSALFLFVKK